MTFLSVSVAFWQRLFEFVMFFLEELGVESDIGKIDLVEEFIGFVKLETYKFSTYYIN